MLRLLNVTIAGIHLGSDILYQDGQDHLLYGGTYLGKGLTMWANLPQLSEGCSPQPCTCVP